MARPEKYTEGWIRKEAKVLLKYAKDTAIPFEKEFTSLRGYSSQRISEFAKKSEEFSEALKRMKDIQETKIVKAALAGEINVTFAIFTLKNVAGWRDLPNLSISGNDKISLLDVIKTVNADSNGGSKDLGESFDNVRKLRKIEIL